MKAKDEPEENKPIASPGLATESFIFEQAYDNTFIIFDRVTQKICSNQYVIVGIREYVPLEKIPWPLCESQPSREVCCERVGIDPAELAKTKEELKELISQMEFEGEYGTEESLYDEVRMFYVDHLDVQNELLYDVYASFTLMTWRVEDFKVVPYLFFLGPLSSGKTRSLECLRVLGYRGLMSSSMTAAAIFRALEQWHCLLLLDESEVYNREVMIEVLALLNAGYRRGNYAIRIERLVKDGPPELGMFDVFGPKAIAGTEELKNTLQSRAILTAMSKNVKPVPIFIDENRAQKLRNKLLMYRFKNLGSEPTFDVSVLKGFFTNARVIELFVSLLEVAPTQEIRDRLIKCMKGITQSRLDEEQSSIEARVFESIMKSESKVDGGKISTQAITDTYNMGLPENDRVTNYFIGRRVKALGFQKCRVGNSGLNGSFWDAELIERLRSRYFPTAKAETPTLDTLLKQPSETSEPSEPSVDVETPIEPRAENESDTDVSDIKTSVLEPVRIEEKTIHADVSDETDVSDVSLEVLASRMKEQTTGPAAPLVACSQVEVSLEALASKTAKLEPLTQDFGDDRCSLCDSRVHMEFQVTEHDGTWGLLCKGCGLQLAKLISGVE